MASGWANDGAVQDQIDSTVNDAVARARSELPGGESNKFCEECGEPIPEARRIWIVLKFVSIPPSHLSFTKYIPQRSASVLIAS